LIWVHAFGRARLSEAQRPVIKTYGDALALSQFRAAIKGKTDAASEIADHTEGSNGWRCRPASQLIWTNLAETDRAGVEGGVKRMIRRPDLVNNAEENGAACTKQIESSL
jgi:hypothetical protein